MEVAAVLKGLVALSRTKPLSFREKKMLERAKYLLVSELATVRNTSESAVEANLIRALAKAKLQMPESSPIPNNRKRNCIEGTASRRRAFFVDQRAPIPAPFSPLRQSLERLRR